MVKKIIGILCMFSLLISCTRPYYKETFVVAGTYLTVSSPHPRAAQIVYDEFKRLDALFNIYNEHSEITKVNNSYNLAVPVSPELIEIIKLAKQAYTLSEGNFDISRGRLYEYWKDIIRKKQSIVDFPSAQEVESLKAQGGIDDIVLDEEAGTVTIAREGLRIDLAGIAKGYMVDRAIQRLTASGIESALIDAGGDVYCLGKNKGQYWQVGIRDPFQKNQVMYPLALYNQAVATSGDYEQFFIYDNKRYSHLISPISGYPQATNIVSVSVLAQNATSADTFATAFFVMGIEGIRHFLSKTPTNLKIFVISQEQGKKKIQVFQ